MADLIASDTAVTLESTSVDDVLPALARLPTFAHPTAAPTGDEVALYYDTTGRNELRVLDVKSGRLDQWSDGEVPRNARWFVEWAASGNTVYFHLDHAGDEQNDLYAISRDGTVDPVVEMDGQVCLGAVGRDNQTLIVSSNANGQQNLHEHSLETGETSKLTNFDEPVWGVQLSPDCERVAYDTNERAVSGNRDVYVQTLDDSQPRVLDLGDPGSRSIAADWGPNSQRLLVSDNATGVTRMGVYNVDRESVSWLGDGSHEESAEAFMPDGDRVIGTRSRNAEMIPVVYDLTTGEVAEFDLPSGFATFGRHGTSVLDEDRVLVSHTTPTTRPRLLAYDLTTHSSETLIAPDYGPFAPAEFVPATYFTFESDGIPATRQAAVVHEPYETFEIGGLFYDSGRRPSPLIVHPHGGPRSRDLKRFDLYTQVLAARGYSVLQVNYRGSSGRGREFAEALYDDWGGAEQGDIAVGVEYVLDRYGWLDEEAVAVFGGSYGGYSAYWQLFQYPDLYDAGVAWMGISDLEAFYESAMPSYREGQLERYLGRLSDNQALYEERSPINHLENLAAPLLIVHGVNDSRVPVSQARRVRTALEEAGFGGGKTGEYEYCELSAEGHASSDQEQKLRLFRLLDDFLQRRLHDADSPSLFSESG